VAVHANERVLQATMHKMSIKRMQQLKRAMCVCLQPLPRWLSSAPADPTAAAVSFDELSTSRMTSGGSRDVALTSSFDLPVDVHVKAGSSGADHHDSNWHY